MTPRSRRIRLETGLEYHFLEWNAASPTMHSVFLLHGFLDFAWTWHPVVDEGLGDVHLVAPDFRGHGDSDRVGAGGYYHFPDYLADLSSLIDLLARPRVSIVGHSMGGSIAAYFASTFSDRAERIALLEGTGPPEQGPLGPERMALFVKGWRKRNAAPLARGYATIADAADKLMANDPKLTRDHALFLAEHGTRAGEDGRLRFKHDPLHLSPMPHGFQFEVASRFWKSIRCPVLLVDAAESMMQHPPEERARRHGLFADKKELIIDGAGHMMQRHQPARLAKLLREFLGSGT